MSDSGPTETALRAELARSRERIAALERALDDHRRTEERFRFLSSAVTQTTEGIVVCDLSGCLVFVNGAFAAMHGYAPEELSGKHLSVFHTPDQMRTVEDAIRRLRETGDFRGEIWHVRRDGTLFVTQMHNALLRDEAGDPIGMIGTVRDVTEHKRAIEALRQSEARFRAVFETAQDAIFIKDRRLRYVQVNPAMARLLGLATSRIVGRTDEDLSGSEAWTHGGQADARVLEGEIVEEDQARSVAGTARTYHVVRVPMRDSSGQIEGICGIARDITERERAEQQRRRMEAKMLQSQKLESLGILAGGVAHDFNNLLTSILGNASLILMDLPPGSAMRESVGLIETAALRAADLTNQMLAYSGRGAFVVESVDLSRLVEEMSGLLGASVTKKITIEYGLAADLPRIEVDASQLCQVIVSLITNAAEAVGDGRDTVRVNTGVVHADRVMLAGSCFDDELPPGPYVYLEVADSGCGMDDETKAKIFDPFFSTKFAGRGLGLAAVLGIVRGHRGAISVVSSPGEGSTFRAMFPQAPCADAEPERPSAPA